MFKAMEAQRRHACQPTHSPSINHPSLSVVFHTHVCAFRRVWCGVRETPSTHTAHAVPHETMTDHHTTCQHTCMNTHAHKHAHTQKPTTCANTAPHTVLTDTPQRCVAIAKRTHKHPNKQCLSSNASQQHPIMTTRTHNTHDIVNVDHPPSPPCCVARRVMLDEPSFGPCR